MAGKTSRINGTKGGRPRGNNTLTAEVARELIATRVGPYLDKITDILIKKALKGDLRAIKELFDRAYGKPTQPIDQKTSPVVFSITEARKKYS